MPKPESLLSVGTAKPITRTNGSNSTVFGSFKPSRATTAEEHTQKVAKELAETGPVERTTALERSKTWEAIYSQKTDGLQSFPEFKPRIRT
jgi:hypothetical protein